jgi:hypothetical protein
MSAKRSEMIYSESGMLREPLRPVTKIEIGE